MGVGEVWHHNIHAVGHTDPGGGYRVMQGPGSQEPPERADAESGIKIWKARGLLWTCQEAMSDLGWGSRPACWAQEAARSKIGAGSALYR